MNYHVIKQDETLKTSYPKLLKKISQIAKNHDLTEIGDVSELF